MLLQALDTQLKIELAVQFLQDFVDFLQKKILLVTALTY